MHKIETPILFLIFNRPDHTAEVLSYISVCQPPRLYVAADGPRNDRQSDKLKCESARKNALKVDWPCEVFTLFREENAGCKRAVSEAITWFFKHEPEGIIIEDDCVPHLDFFKFCEYGLKKFRNDPRVMAITGDNFQDGKLRGGASYYFSKYPHCWGWATWRRAWLKYDPELTFWNQWSQSNDWKILNHDNKEISQWNQLARQVQNKHLDSWATPWMFSVWYNGGLTLTPNVNLVTNIGMGVDATHTIGDETKRLVIPSCPMGIITDSEKVERNEEADRYVFLHVYGGINSTFPRSVLSTLKKLFKPARYTAVHLMRNFRKIFDGAN